jgi:rRNA processing protein Gar1
VYILKKTINKSIGLNVVDLKYLFLDSNIMASAITTKLKDRKKRVLKVLKRILGLIKKPYFKIHLYNKKKTLEKVHTDFLFMDEDRTGYDNP